MKNNILVEVMNGDDTGIYNLLMKEVTSGIIKFKNPQGEEGLVVLQILGSNVKTDLIKEEGRNILVKKVDIKASIAETQGKLLINQDVIKEIKEMNEAKMEEALVKTFNTYKSKGLDIINGRRMLEINYENNIPDNYLENLELEVEVDLIIEGTSLIKDTAG